MFRLQTQKNVKHESFYLVNRCSNKSKELFRLRKNKNVLFVEWTHLKQFLYWWRDTQNLDRIVPSFALTMTQSYSDIYSIIYRSAGIGAFWKADWRHMTIELEQVRNPAWRPRPEEKLAVKSPIPDTTRAQILSKPHELFDRLDRTQQNVGYTRLN